MKKTTSLWMILGFVCMISSTTYATDASVDQLLDLILSNSGSTTSTVQTPSTTTTSVSSGSVVQPSEDDEFKNALSWMYTNGLTQFSTTQTYEPTQLITRQQAAKFFVVMQETILQQIPTTAQGSCAFKDTGFDQTLRPYVDKACAYGIMIGSNGTFRPNASISRPEFVTALVRMIEGAKRDETGNPWWIQYYQQARDRNITKERNANAFDVFATRYEAALFLYRSLAVLRQTTPTQPVHTTTGSVGTGSTIDTGVVVSNPNQPLTSVISEPALQEAIYWMNDNDMTKYTKIEDYRPFDTVTRQESAKIFTLFRHTIIQGEPSSTGTSCAFDDLNIADQTLVSYIKEACKLQILKGSNNLFNPEGFLTKPQAVAILVRMLEGPQDESGAIRWKGYYDRALALGMIEPTQTENFDKPISRYEIAMLLYNSKIKYELLKNLNNNYETNKLIYPVPGSIGTGSNTGETVGLVSINTQILQRSDLDTYIIDLFGDQYKLERIATQKYLDNDYVRYGKIISLDETQQIGTATFTMSNGIIIDGVLRPYTTQLVNYFIKPSQQQPYYDMTKKLK